MAGPVLGIYILSLDGRWGSRIILINVPRVLHFSALLLLLIHMVCRHIFSFCAKVVPLILLVSESDSQMQGSTTWLDWFFLCAHRVHCDDASATMASSEQLT